RRAFVLRAAGTGAARAALPVPAQALRAVDRGRCVPAQVRRAAAQVQVPVLDLHLGRVLRLVRRLVVRDRPDRPPIRARDGARARGEASGAARERAALHPVPGAMITMREMPQDAWNEAKVAIAGPLVGSLGAAAIWVAGEATDSNHLKALAFLGFLINLFNLLPVVPLDGGRIVAALHPALWILGFAGLLGLVVIAPNPLLIIIVVLAGLELWNRWRMRNHPQLQSYYRVTAPQRAMV